MKQALLAGLCLMLAACAAGTTPATTYRPASGGSPWLIAGTLKQGVVSDRLAVTINGQEVAAGELTPLKLQDTFIGQYQGTTITAECRAVPVGMTYNHSCTVFAGAERAAIINF